MSIPFTQYLRPNGKRRLTNIERPPEIEAIAERFIASGGCYESEELTTGHVSLTAVKAINGEPEDDVAIEVCMNGPAVADAVDRLIKKSESFI